MPAARRRWRIHLGEGAIPHVFDHAGRIAEAEIRRRHFHVEKVGEASLCTAADCGLMVAHRHIEGCCRFSCKSQKTVAVGAVVGDLKFHYGIVVSDDLVDILAYTAVLIVEDPDGRRRRRPARRAA